MVSRYIATWPKCDLWAKIKAIHKMVRLGYSIEQKKKKKKIKISAFQETDEDRVLYSDKVYEKMITEREQCDNFKHRCYPRRSNFRKAFVPYPFGNPIC